MLKRIIIASISLLFSIDLFAQTTVVLSATQDNSMFSENGTYSNGTGEQLFAGRINSGGALRRALIKFNVSSIPPNAIITDAKLEIYVELSPRTNLFGFNNFSIHKLTKNWGEGASISFSGRGSTAQTNDATWEYNFYTSSQWTNPGGDFVATATATATGRLNLWSEWNGTGVINDINAWRSNSTTNYGWILLGEETVNASARVFSSRSNGSNPPKLTITYTLPAADKILINEVNPTAKWVELYNPSTQVVNLNNYYVVNNANTSALVGGSVNVLNGNLSLNPNEYIVLGWNSIGATTGEIALYNNNPTGSGVMMDYVQYGAANQSKATAAVIAQVWNSATAFLSGLNLNTNTYSLDPSVSYPLGGKSSNSTHWLTRKQTPTYQNVICPNSLNLNGNIINAQYNAIGDIISIGNLNSTSNSSFISQKAVILNPNFRVDSGAVFEAKISNCN
jgi:hypothetical protein